VPAAVAPGLGLSLEPPEERVRYRDHHHDAGVDGAAAELACRPFAESLSLCFTWTSPEGRRYVTLADLQGWGLDLEGVEARTLERARQALQQSPPVRTAVVDMDATYWLRMEGDGLDLAGFLDPAALEADCGGDLRVAVPGRDIFMAWSGGSGEVDRVLAVGVARIHEASDHPVTSKVYQWDATKAEWVVWGQARR